MLINLFNILYNLKDERRRYTWNKPFGLDECLSTSLKNSSGDCVRYSRSDLWISIVNNLDKATRIGKNDSHYQRQEE